MQQYINLAVEWSLQLHQKDRKQEFLRLSKVLEMLHNEIMDSTVLNNIGCYYFGKKKFEAANHYINLSLQASQTQPTIHQTLIKINKIKILQILKQQDKALKLIKEISNQKDEPMSWNHKLSLTSHPIQTNKQFLMAYLLYEEACCIVEQNQAFNRANKALMIFSLQFPDTPYINEIKSKFKPLMWGNKFTWVIRVQGATNNLKQEITHSQIQFEVLKSPQNTEYMKPQERSFINNSQLSSDRCPDILPISSLNQRYKDCVIAYSKTFHNIRRGSFPLRDRNNNPPKRILEIRINNLEMQPPSRLNQTFHQPQSTNVRTNRNIKTAFRSRNISLALDSRFKNITQIMDSKLESPFYVLLSDQMREKFDRLQQIITIIKENELKIKNVLLNDEDDNDY